MDPEILYSTDRPPLAKRCWQLLVRNRLRLSVAAVLAVVAAVVLNPFTRDPFPHLLLEMFFVAAVLLVAFAGAGAWKQTWVPPWVAQVVAVILAAPLAELIVQLISVDGDLLAFMSSRPRVIGFWWVTIGGSGAGLLVTTAALVRERDALAKSYALQFALEKEKLERQATDARLSLLQAQIEPHFLLNTLANVQELIESGSPRAAPVFKSLIAYLRAAMPQLHQGAPTLGTEAGLVQSYLELMLMRMPDRLKFRVDIPQDLRGLRFPSMALLTLVENAVRHGIDPSEDGGEIEVGARRSLENGVNVLRIWVADTGVGMAETATPGTGLSNLRARLQAFFDPQAQLEMSELPPHGLKAEIVLKHAV
jgi:signal transduction histidine kinase